MNNDKIKIKIFVAEKGGVGKTTTGELCYLISTKKGENPFVAFIDSSGAKKTGGILRYSSASKKSMFEYFALDENVDQEVLRDNLLNIFISLKSKILDNKNSCAIVDLGQKESEAFMKLFGNSESDYGIDGLYQFGETHNIIFDINVVIGEFTNSFGTFKKLLRSCVDFTKNFDKNLAPVAFENVINLSALINVHFFKGKNELENMQNAMSLEIMNVKTTCNVDIIGDWFRGSYTIGAFKRADVDDNVISLIQTGVDYQSFLESSYVKQFPMAKIVLDRQVVAFNQGWYVDNK